MATALAGAIGFRASASGIKVYKFLMKPSMDILVHQDMRDYGCEVVGGCAGASDRKGLASSWSRGDE